MTSLKAIRKIMIAAALAIPVALVPTSQAHAGIFISVGFAPPVLPVYAQPLCPGDGYIWTPGYWAYTDDGGYYWVPGVWVQPPTVGVLWTPAYWGWENGAYLFHDGYWGPHVGFYGGVNYGFGYGGIGFAGGEWRGGHFAYNSAVANIGGVHVTNVYVDREVVVHNTIVNANHASFNGGSGGISVRPRPEEVQAMHEQHIQPTGQQLQHQSFSAQNRSQFASANHGRPGVTAAASPAAFHANPGAAHPAAAGFAGHEAAPQEHAAPVSRTAPESHPAPAPAAHTAPAGHPAHPAPAAHPAPHEDKH